MNSVIKVVLFSVLGVYVLNVALTGLSGQAAFVRCITSDTHFTLRRDSIVSVNFLTNLELTDAQFAEIETKFAEFGVRLKYIQIDDENNLSQYLAREGQLNYLLFKDFNFFSPVYTLHESENAGEYVQYWRMKYIWLFGGWIKIEDENMGIS